jgi:hypothetical protein
LENDSVKADLAGDPEFYQKVLVEDWTRGDSEKTAVATYKDTYDIQIMGEHRAHTIIATFVKIDGEWKQIASHGSEAK